MPILRHASNNYTFPAVTINFFLPEGNMTDDPWEYILSSYAVYFKTEMFSTDKVEAVPCDTVSGYT